MARIKRRSKIKNLPEKNIETSKTPKQKFGDLDVKSYLEEAKEILDILESNGINLYDEDRYGGMHLEDAMEEQKNQKNNITSKNKLFDFFDKQNK